MAHRERAWVSAIAVGLLVYAFAYDNANSWPMALGYAWTRLTPIGREARLVEIPVVLGLVGWAMATGMSRVTRRLLASLLAFIALGLLSYYRDGDVPLLDGVRLVYMWVLPALMFIIGRELPWPAGTAIWIRRTVLTFALVTSVVSWVQLVWFQYPVGDDITGLAKDAHANGTLLMFVAIQCTAAALFRSRPVLVAAALFFLITMVLSSVLKVMFFGIAALAWVGVRYLQSRGDLARIMRAAAGWGVAAVLAVIGMFSAFSHIDEISSSRLGETLDKIVSDPTSFGPVLAHRVAFSKISTELPTLALGMGPFHLANPISVGQVSGTLSSKASGDVLAILDEKGEQARITLTSSLLGEFGIPAFLIVLFAYGVIAAEIRRAARHADLEIRWRGVGAVGAGLVFMLIPVASLFGSFDVISVSWAFMLSAGVLCRDAAHTPPREAA